MKTTQSLKGSVALLVLIIIVILSALIIIASFYIKTNPGLLTQLKGEKIVEKQAATTQTTETINKSVPSTKSNNNGKILFLTQEGKLSFASLDGKSVEPFNAKLNEEAKSLGAGTSSSSVSPDRKYLLAEGASMDNKLAEYIISLEDKSFFKIDQEAIKKQFGYTSIVYFWTWTPDSEKLVYSADQRAETLPGNIKRSIGTYDIQTKEAKELYSEEEYKTEFFPGRLGVIYYDPATESVIFTDDNAKTIKDTFDSNRPLGYLVNLKTKQKTQFKEPNTYNDGSLATGKYFVVNNSLIGPYQRKELSIYSFDQANVPISKVNLNTNDKSFYNQYIKWSPNYDYYAIEVYNAQPDTQEKLANSRIDQTVQVFIYSRDGKLISRTNVPAIGGSPGPDIIFSGDGQKVLVYGELVDGSKKELEKDVLWRFYDIAGKEKPKDTVSSKLGRAIYWFD